MDLKQYPKFDGTNWESWRFIFRAWCRSIEAIHLVDAVSIEKGTVAESDEDNKLNVRIYVFICMTIVDSHQQYIRSVKEGDGVAAYRSLEKIYDSKSSNSIVQSLEEVVGSKQNGQPAIDFVTKVKSSVDKLKTTCTSLNIDIFSLIAVTVMLGGLDAAFASLVEAIHINGELDVEKVSAAILERDERIKIAGASTESMAMTAKYNNYGNRPKNPLKPCPHCQEAKGRDLFHTIDQCFVLHPELRNNHGRGRGNVRNGKHQFVKGSTAEVQQADAEEYGAWTATVIDTQVYAATTSNRHMLSLKVDSGASGVDCFLKPEDTLGMHSVRNVNVPIAQLGKDRVSATISGFIGNVQGAPLQALTGTDITTSLISVSGLNKRNVGVYFSSNATGNKCLFIDEANVNNIDTVVNTRSVVKEGYMKGQEYFVDITVDGSVPPVKVDRASVSPLQLCVSEHKVECVSCHRSSIDLRKLSIHDSIRLLHCRANHRSPEQLYELVQNHSVGGPVSRNVALSVYQEALRNCEVCPLAKMKGRSHVRAADPIKRATKPFQYIHMDVKYMHDKSYGGKQYINTVVDDYTNDINPLVQQSKAEVPVKLFHFNRDFVRPISGKIQHIKLDRGGENISIAMKDLGAHAGFQMHFTNKSDSQANGKAERANQTLGNDVRAARIGSDGRLNEKAWAELAKGTALINRFLPTTANPAKKSPQEMFSPDEKPNIDFMRILGSVAFAHVSPKDRRNNDDKAIKGVLVGYGQPYPGGPVTFYRIKEKGTNRIIETDDCIIHENIPGFGNVVSEMRQTADTISDIYFPDDAEVPNKEEIASHKLYPIAPVQPVQISAVHSMDKDRVQPPPSQLSATHLHVNDRLASFIDPALLRYADSVGESQQTVASPGESSALIQRQQQPVSTHRSTRTVEVSSRQSSRGPTAVESQGESCIPNKQQQQQPVSSRRSTRTAGVNSLQFLHGPPTAHFARVIVPFCDNNGFQDPISHAAKSLVEKKTYINTLETPGAARGMLRELVNLLEGNKVEVIERPSGIKPITSTWAHKEQKEWKLQHDGKLSDGAAELRSRMCPRGYEQVPGESYNPDRIEAPTPHHETVRLFHSLTVNRSQHVILIDEKSAFMETPLDDGDEVYMEFPDGMLDPTGTHCLRMLNSINGIKQAANNYYRRSKLFLLNEGFQVSKKDPCYFYKWIDGVYFQVLVWVDDSRIACDLDGLAEEFATKFLATHKGTRSDGTDYLGTDVDYNRAKGTLTVSLKKKVQSLLRQFGMEDCNPVSTPAVPHTHLTKATGDNPADQTFDYISAVYTMYWIALIGKPEILFAVRDMSQYTHDFDQSHVIAAKHTMRYLKGKLDEHLTLRRGTPGYIRTRVYADADFAGCPEESLTPMRSTSGILVYLVGIGMILPVCKGQPTIARSTAEAEYRCSGLASTIVVGIDEFLAEIGFPQDGPTVIHEDNTACIKMTKSLLCGSKSRHIKIEHHFIRELVANNQITLEACMTSKMVADLFTKNLAKPQFEYLRDILYYSL